jgi:hypothetical protein
MFNGNVGEGENVKKFKVHVYFYFSKSCANAK